MNRNLFGKLVFLATTLFAINNVASSEIRPLLTPKQLSEPDITAEKFFRKVRTTLEELNPENLNKKLNNGEDLFELGTIIDGETRQNKINSAIASISETTQRIGKGMYDVVLCKTGKLLEQVTNGKLFNKNDADNNYVKLMNGLDNIFAPADIDDKSILDNTSEKGENDDCDARFNFDANDLKMFFLNCDNPN